ncbi:hypothetical protein [Poriferisphaera sp. WC338]|uniref:hypothetical protein n=1 Tax=Poriferisphaera sp. WC338 TaxID=3425129 RepID=UPI003D818C78
MTDSQAPSKTNLYALDHSCIVRTIRQIQKRIDTSLPGRNISGVAHELQQLATQAAGDARKISRPNITLRLVNILLVVSLLSLIGYVSTNLNFSASAPGWEVLEGSEAAISSIVYVGIAIIFFVTLESRIKRQRILKKLHQLRVLAHIIDMHQLAKDPEHFLYHQFELDTRDPNNLTPYMLGRYLDYCSELLSMIGKIAVLHAQYSQDTVVLDAVNEIETLTTGLSRKIWQKIMILDQIVSKQQPAHSSSITQP